jgi:hypothetical protein
MTVPPGGELVALAGITAALVGGISGWIGSWLQARLARRTQAELAAANFRYSGQLQDLSLFAAKKHEVVAELYKRLVDATSKLVSRTRGISSRPMLELMNLTDVKRYMDSEQVLDAVQQDVLTRWPTDRYEAEERLLEHLSKFELENAQRSFQLVKNYYLNHDIYLGASTRETLWLVIGKLGALMMQLRPPKGVPAELLAPGEPDLIMVLRDEAQMLLRAELDPAFVPDSRELSVTKLGTTPR